MRGIYNYTCRYRESMWVHKRMPTDPLTGYLGDTVINKGRGGKN